MKLGDDLLLLSVTCVLTTHVRPIGCYRHMHFQRVVHTDFTSSLFDESVHNAPILEQVFDPVFRMAPSAKQSQSIVGSLLYS